MIIKDNYIEADEGKILYCTWDELCYGQKAFLGKVYYKDKTKLKVPHVLTVDEFVELNSEEVEIIDNKCFDFRGMTYAAIKTSVIKLHYSNDDQIAIILNNDEDKMREMQEWREYAASIARKYNPI